jgi:hypothetical protein
MKTLRGTFDNLVSTMKRYDLYQKDDEVGMELNELSNLIDEVEKRMECAIRSNREIDEVVFSFVDAFEDRGEIEQTLTYGQFEVMLRGVHDIDIALDLKENECIDNNWYNLFKPKVTQLANQTDISVDDVVKVAMGLKMNPNIEEINEVLKYYNSEAEESTETWDLIVENLLYNCVAPSNQKIEDKVELSGGAKADFDDLKKELPTTLSNDKYKYGVVDYVIAKLKEIDVDGETMQYIIEQVGMNDQMLRQLIMSNPYTDTTDILEEKRILSDARLDAISLNK